MENFTLLSFRYIESMEELSEKERKLLFRFLSEEWCDLDDEYNVFSLDRDWHTDLLCFAEWQYQNKVIIDVYGYPGDNEDGCLFLDDTIIAWVGDHDLGASEDCPPDLKELLPDLAHLRPNGNLDCEENHPYCQEQHRKYVVLSKRECKCQVCQET